MSDIALTVRLPEALYEALKRRAVVEDRTFASLLRVAARAYLEATPVWEGEAIRQFARIRETDPGPVPGWKKDPDLNGGIEL